MGKKYIADAFVKNGATADDILVGDGSTTSKAALGGGGAGERDFVATGTIGVGAVVALKSDGTVEVVTDTAAGNTLEPLVDFTSFTISQVDSVFDPVANRVVVIFKKTSDTFRYSVIGTIVGNTISFTTHTLVVADQVHSSSLIYDSFSGNIVFVYTSSNNTGQSIVGTVGSSSITWGNAQAFISTSAQKSLASNGKGQILISCRKSSVLFNAIPGTISGLQISFGTTVTITTVNVYDNTTTYDSVADAFLIAYSTAAGSGIGIVATLSGNTITLGTGSTFSSVAIAKPLATYNTVAGKIALAYNASGDYKIQAATISGLTATYGSVQQISSNVVADEGSIVYDSIEDRLVVTAGGSYFNKMIFISQSGNTFTVDSDLGFSPNRTTTARAVIDTVNNHIITSWYNFSGTSFGGSQVYIYPQITTNAASTIGINTTAKVNAETATVSILAGTSGGHSSLFIGDICYVNYQGTITQTLPTDAFGFKRLGIAVSATEILLDLQEEDEQITITQSQISDLSINIADLGDELSGVATLPTGNNAIDFKANIQYDKTLDAAWSPTFTNPIKGKSIVIIATGANAAYTLTLPATIKGDISGFDGTKTNQLTLYCLDATTPVYSIDIKTW